MTSLRLPRSICERLEADALERYPHEACGLLIGRWSREGGTIVLELRLAENVATGNRRRAFTIAPEELLKAQKDARAAGLEIVGTFHSHPHQAAIPSRDDLAAAWPEISYLILSVCDETASELRSWRLDRKTGTFAEERIEYVA